MNQRPDGHEIIVVDNASTDRTRDVVEEAAASCPTGPIHYFYEPMPGLLSGRHRGAMEARGNICAFLDDDIRVGRDWLIGLEDAFRDPSVVLVGGPSRPLFEKAPPDWLASFYAGNGSGQSCGWLSLLDCGDVVTEIDPVYIWGLNFTILRTALFDLGGFHPDALPKPLQRFQGDGETGLSFKVAGAGLKALYHRQVSVLHEIPASRLTAQYFEERAFFQGVCDSYTQIRGEGKLAQAKRSWKDPFRPIKRTLEALRDAGTGINTVRHRTARAYKAGFAFHQEEVSRDPKLLEWVLRKDYWDYRLPEGWEDFYTIPGAANFPEVEQLQ
jgi:glucosyl-dolichyl phosphate glucuronosyltransferase